MSTKVFLATVTEIRVYATTNTYRFHYSNSPPMLCYDGSFQIVLGLTRLEQSKISY